MKNDFKSCPYNTTQLFNQKSTFVYDDDGNIIAENIKNITINKPTKCTKENCRVFKNGECQFNYKEVQQ